MGRLIKKKIKKSIHKRVKAQIKKLIKRNLLIYLAPLILILLMIIFVMVVTLMQLNNTMAILPAAEEDQVESYKEVAKEANLEWSDMLILDTVRYENEFEKADPKETGLLFLSVRVKKTRKTTYTDKDGNKRVTKQTTKNNYYTKEKIFNLVKSFFDIHIPPSRIKDLYDEKDVTKIVRILEYYDGYSSTSGNTKTKINISFGSKSLELVMEEMELTQDQLEWAYVLLEENFIHEMFGETYDLPEFIEVDGEGFFAWPVPDLTTITSHYGSRIHPVTGERSFHFGVDISGAGAQGKPVIAAADGIAFQTNYMEGAAGNNIRIRHYDEEGNEWQTRYCHLSQIEVNQGQEVKKGEVIGAVGNTGRSTGPHLHLEMKFSGQLVDPLRYMLK